MNPTEHHSTTNVTARAGLPDAAVTIVAGPMTPTLPEWRNPELVIGEIRTGKAASQLVLLSREGNH